MASSLDRIRTPCTVGEMSDFWRENLEECRGKQEAIEKVVGFIPTINLPSLDAVRVTDLSHPVMKGTHADGRLYTTFRLIDKVSRETFAICYAQAAKNTPHWVEKSTVNKQVFLMSLDFKNHLKDMQRLMDGTHPNFSIV